MDTQVKLGIIGGFFAVLVAITQIVIPAFIQQDNTADEKEPVNPALTPNVVVNVTPVVPFVTPSYTTANTILFSDYFSDDTSGWRTDPESEECKVYYNDKLIFKKVNDDPTAMFYSPLETYKPPMDFIVEFDAKVERERDDNRVGISFRRIDSDNFYLFLISSDRDYTFRKYVNGDYSSIIDWTRSDFVNAAKETNTIKIKCEGDIFTFYINGNKVDSCSDSTFPDGSIALAAGVGDDDSGNNRFSFDNFKVKSITN